MMVKGNQGKSKNSLWALVLGISLMIAFCGWFVYAEEISKEVSREVDIVAKSAAGPGSPPAYGLDDQAILLQKTTRSNVERTLVESINAGLYDVGPLSLNSAPRTEVMIANHFSWFCAPQPAGPEQGSDCKGDEPLMQYGDVKVSSVLSGTVYNQDRQKAVTQFLFNLIPISDKNFKSFMDPQTKQITAASFPATLESKDPRSKDFPNPQQQFAQALADQALLSVAREPYAEMIAKRTSTGDTESMMQMMERNAVQRFMSSQWRETLKTLKQEQLLQELAVMQAYQVWLEYQRYRQTERLEALLSTMIVQNYNQSQAAAAKFASIPTGTPATGR